MGLMDQVRHLVFFKNLIWHGIFIWNIFYTQRDWIRSVLCHESESVREVWGKSFLSTFEHVLVSGLFCFLVFTVFILFTSAHNTLCPLTVYIFFVYHASLWQMEPFILHLWTLQTPSTYFLQIFVGKHLTDSWN